MTFGFDNRSFELSPDGRQLAYAYLPVEGLPGVAVADLVAGTVRFIPLDIGKRGLVQSLIWSPHGEYLIWWGQPHTANGFGNTMAGPSDREPARARRFRRRTRTPCAAMRSRMTVGWR